jgi:hypothetical protein
MNRIRFILVFTAFFALLLSSCDTAPENVKSLVIENIPKSIELCSASLDIMTIGHATMNLDQSSSATGLLTEGVYIFAAVLPQAAFDQVVNDVIGGTLSPKEVPEFAEAFCLTKIVNASLTQRLLGIEDMAAFWEGGTSPGYYTALIYMTPDARFVIRCDISVASYAGTVTEFRYNYLGGDFTSIYDIKELTTPPVPLLGDDFLMEIVDKL